MCSEESAIIDFFKEANGIIPIFFGSGKRKIIFEG